MPKTEDSRQSQLRVGRLTKAHGLKGALKVEMYTDDPQKRFVPGAQFSLQVPESSPWFGKTLTLNELRWYNASPVAFFEDVPDRTAAESLIKAILWAEVDEEAEQEPDAWYDHQLVGLAVLREGVQVGKIVRVEHMPAQDLLVIDSVRGEVMLPFVAALVPAVDIAAGTVSITPPGGLFEDLDDEVDETDDPSAAKQAAAAAE